ncbi:NAD(P)/FAD-dependent oxidoreductase [Rubinisphaera sp. JC750]|uniref:NAD(P)/FAD-dependent oxidoreductase n=1 Tax=Rubinisphaera sp. JC750 TaxID=2898658 RepID=UPI0021BC7CEA|nr:NAD(P)/FAD-dependent oxidoreductase [Rubinisphaera sp. JC750]
MLSGKDSPAKPVIVVGAGLAGLACGMKLHKAGIPFRIFEASDAVGGRVRTDEKDGFLLDRGFQVLLTAYPAAQELLDYKTLDLRTFEPGAEIWTGRSFECISDPFRRPGSIWQTARARVGSVLDKLRIGQLRLDVMRTSLSSLFERDETTSHEALRKYGFSDELIETFFRPFFGGIFLEKDLTTSSRMLQFVYRMFSQGEAALPAGGMGEIPRQMASRLPSGTITLNTAVVGFDENRVTLGDGTTIEHDGIVLAVEEPALSKFLPDWPDRGPRPAVRCLYFSASKPPVKRNVLVLNGAGRGLVNNVAVPSQLSDRYAPAGKSLVSVSVVASESKQSDAELAGAVQQELESWFGEDVQSWKLVAGYNIPDSLPSQSSIPLALPQSVAIPPYLTLAGDYMLHGSQQGALESGVRAAEAIVSRQAVSAAG